MENKCKCIKGINCAVTNCVHHDGKCYCTADKVHIGPKEACECGETVCGTFESRDNTTF